jgi:hypothetical protein
MRIAILVAAFCLLPLLVLAQPAPLTPPEGWRFPMEDDYIGSWQIFRTFIAEPFHVQADFNGDGLPDDAWILLSIQDKSWGLFVFLAQKDGPPKVITLDKNPGTSVPQYMGIKAVQPGDYQTACAKGPVACKHGEPEVLHLALPAINYFVFEGANSFFWWDAQSQSFKRTWIGYAKEKPVPYGHERTHIPKSSPFSNPF